MLCKYRHIFGVEEKGAHSIRILNIAVVDLLATLLVGALISYYFKVNLYLIWLILLVVGILVHRLFCVNSTINKFIFGKV
jgi:fatty-acid desaturase